MGMERISSRQSLYKLLMNICIAVLHLINQLFKDYVQGVNMLYYINCFWGILHLITAKIYDIPYNLILTTKCNDSSIVITIIT